MTANIKRSQSGQSGRCLLTLAVAAFVVSTVSGTAVAQSNKQCWSPEQLRYKGAREGSVVKNISNAYHAVPRGQKLRRSKRYPPLGKVIRRVKLPPGKKLIAFTFDLCEQPYEISGYQGDIVDYLRDNKVAATFFAGGKWLLTHPRRGQQIIADPRFEVANHAWEHRNFQLLSGSRIDTEVAGAQLAYQKTYDKLQGRACLAPNGRPAHLNAEPQQSLFRFPYGACTPAAIAAVERYGMRVIQWDVSSADPWRGQTTEGIVSTVLKRTRPGSIVLFHANGRGWRTGNAIPTLVRALRKRGYKFVTVTELLKAGEPVYASACYDARPGDSDRYQKVSRRLEGAYDRFYKKFGGKRPVMPSTSR